MARVMFVVCVGLLASAVLTGCASSTDMGKVNERLDALEGKLTKDLAARLEKSLATKVTITGSAKRGTVKVHYYSAEDLNRLAEAMLKKGSS